MPSPTTWYYVRQHHTHLLYVLMRDVEDEKWVLATPSMSGRTRGRFSTPAKAHQAIGEYMTQGHRAGSGGYPTLEVVRVEETVIT